MKTFVFSLFLFLFLTSPVRALDCSTTEGCYRPGAGIAGPDCSCPWIDGGDNSRCIEGGCPQVVDCQWSEWSECSVNCGGGIQTRTIKTEAQGGGQECIGSFQQTCNTNPCPWRRGECDTDTGEYTCTQVGQNEEIAGQTIYETEGECREDDGQCSEVYIKKVWENCWTKTIYTMQKGGLNLALADLDKDGKEDLVSIDVGCSVVFLKNEDGNKFSNNGVEVFKTIRLTNTTNQKCQSIVGKNNEISFVLREISPVRKRYVYTGGLDFEDKKIEDGVIKYEVLSNQGLFNLNSTISSKYVDVNTDGKLDLILALGDDYYGTSRERGYFILYGGEDNFVGENPYIESLNNDLATYGTSYDMNRLAVGDIQGDGKNNDLAWLAGDESIKVLDNVNGLGEPKEINTRNTGYRNTALAFFDLDSDGKEESLIVVGFYHKSGTNDYLGHIRIFSKIDGLWKGIHQITNIEVKTLSSVLSVDFDNDGFKDILALGEKGILLVRNNKGQLSDEAVLLDGQGSDLMKFGKNGLVYKSYIGGVTSGSLQANVLINNCTSSGNNNCNTCEGKEGDKSKGDANCDGKVDLADFEAWRGEYFDGENKDNWKADFNCSKELSKPDLSDFNIWRTSYFGV